MGAGSTDACTLASSRSATTGSPRTVPRIGTVSTLGSCGQLREGGDAVADHAAQPRRHARIRPPPPGSRSELAGFVSRVVTWTRLATRDALSVASSSGRDRSGLSHARLCATSATTDKLLTQCTEQCDTMGPCVVGRARGHVLAPALLGGRRLRRGSHRRARCLECLGRRSWTCSARLSGRLMGMEGLGGERHARAVLAPIAHAAHPADRCQRLDGDHRRHERRCQLGPFAPRGELRGRRCCSARRDRVAIAGGRPTLPLPVCRGRWTSPDGTRDRRWRSTEMQWTPRSTAPNYQAARLVAFARSGGVCQLCDIGARTGVTTIGWACRTTGRYPLDGAITAEDLTALCLPWHQLAYRRARPQEPYPRTAARSQACRPPRRCRAQACPPPRRCSSPSLPIPGRAEPWADESGLGNVQSVPASPARAGHRSRGPRAALGSHPTARAGQRRRMK